MKLMKKYNKIFDIRINIIICLYQNCRKYNKIIMIKKQKNLINKIYRHIQISYGYRLFHI